MEELMIKHNLMFDCPKLEIDVDKLLEQIQNHYQTVGQVTLPNDCASRPVHHPSWEGRLETEVKTSPNDQSGSFRCGR